MPDRHSIRMDFQSIFSKSIIRIAMIQSNFGADPAKLILGVPALYGESFTPQNPSVSGLLVLSGTVRSSSQTLEAGPTGDG